MTKETKSNLQDLTWAVISFALIITLFAYGQRYVNNQKAQFIKEVKVDGQGKN